MSLEQMAEAADTAVAAEEKTPLPGMIEAEQAQDEAESSSALMVSAQAVNFVADVAEARFECLRYGPETRQQGAEKIAPLLIKYGISGGVLGEFLERWKEEIAAGMFFGGVIWASVKAVKEHNAATETAAPAADNVTPLDMGDGISGD